MIGNQLEGATEN